MAAPADRIPVSILTGFLGAGKSSLLNRLLKDPDMADTAVIINEFGEVGIDHLLVESSGDAMVELSNGCLCCTVRGELTDTLVYFREAMADGRIKPLKRVVIETTGLADPAPVIQSIIGNPEIARDFSIDGVIALVDAVNGLSTLDHHEEARRQVAVADRLIFTKLTLADTDVVPPLTERLRALNPLAEIIDGDSARAARYATLSAGLYDSATKIADVGRWLHDEAHDDHICDDHCGHDHHHGHHHHRGHRHDDEIKSFSIIHDRPVDPAAIGMFIDLLRSAHAERLLRMKAIVALTDDPERPLILHGVQSVFHPPERLAKWPDAADRRTRMVLITRNLPQDFVQSVFDAFTGTPRIDRPDRQALEDNPLAIPGMKM
ncbi:GTP-binding protein [Rhizobium sp. KVB221]|uniref:GTP-binding protein n=1 Tax=Rhizobium setariae TaxID=2801340 RepID=A0A937CQS9_9HYPH|nr:GTP-binding protein [Rhizobium setariae]MBL0374904.1 GTP-binding protein [Rhizobium setariae]